MKFKSSKSILYLMVFVVGVIIVLYYILGEKTHIITDTATLPTATTCLTPSIPVIPVTSSTAVISELPTPALNPALTNITSNATTTLNTLADKVAEAIAAASIAGLTTVNNVSDSLGEVNLDSLNNLVSGGKFNNISITN